MDVFTSLYALLQTALDSYVHETVIKAVNYVDGPVAAMATATMIAYGMIFLAGKSSWPFMELVKSFGTIALVFALAGTAGHYNEYLGNSLHGLPGDLMSVFAVGDAPVDEQGFGATMDEFGAQAMDGIVTIWNAGLSYKFLAIFLFGIFLLFAIAACVAMGIAMVGSSLVVGIGPVMILGLLHRATYEYFTRWISYGVQFAILAAFVGGVLGIMSHVLTKYLAVMTQQTDIIDFNELAAPAIIMGICAYIFGQLPSMASSVSGGIGLSVGNTAWRGMSKATQATLWHAGGKKADAYVQAGQRRRIESSVEARKERAEWRRDKWESLTSPNKVDGE